MAARTFIWIANGGGAWSLAANWDDQTDGQNPSTLVPGAQDDVIVAGPSGSSVETITGAGAVAAALFTGNTILSGSFSAGTLTIGTAGAGGVLQLAAGTLLQSTSASLAAGGLLVNGTNAALSVAGTLGVGDGQTDGLSASLDVTGGGHAAVLGLLMDVANCSIYVDPASVLEVGGADAAAAGYLTVDSGALLAGEGDANAYGLVANGGTIEAAGGTLALGTLSGTGTLLIEAGATLELNGACGAGQTVQFVGANGVLDIQAEFYAPAGTLAGFSPGDAIDVSGSLISSATFAQSTTGDGGILTLYYGSQVADRISLAGNYLGSTFLTAGDGAGGTLITVAAEAGGGGTPSPGTSTPDQYIWVGQGSGLWNEDANWQDLTSGADPAGIAPGVNDIVSINAAAGSFTVVGGPANAASLSLTGELAFSGAYGLGSLDVGQVTSSNFVNGTLDLLPGTSITATTASISAGAISVAGSGARLSIGGTLSLGGGISGVGLPVTALTVTSGARVQAGTLILGGGSGDNITTDPTSSLEIGTLGDAALGAVTIDHGATLSGNGSVNPLGKIVDNGRIVATGGVLTLGTVTGSGGLVIGDGTLDLAYATTRPIAFTSSASTLAIAGMGASPTGVLTGLVLGDVIDILGDPIDSAQFDGNANGTGGTIWLIYGSTVEGQLTVSGNFSQLQFIAVPDGNGGTLIELAPNNGGGGGGPGQSGTDQLVWNGSQGDGDWGNPANWTDITIGKPATAPPGAETPAIMAGPFGATYQSVSGTGTCASLALSGNTDIQGVYTFGTLTFGRDATATAPATSGTLVIYQGTTLTATTVFVADGVINPDGDDSELIDVTGTLTLGDGSETPSLIVQAGGVVEAGALVLGGGFVSVDAFSSVEIGALGDAAAGALTVDAGCAVTGEGSLNVLGTIIDDGTITAQGGALLLGAAGGAGTIEIATEASLSLTSRESVAIDFAGAGATLIIPGSGEMPSGTVAGFGPGDSILVSGIALDTVVYAPGTGGIGTLTLYAGGQVAGTILLAGNYAGHGFAVVPAGAGAEITVSASGGGGPPPGTTTPDQYVWVGGNGVDWSNAANWTDLTQSQSPAAVAPGQYDLVTIAATDTTQDINGPADAAELTLMGTVALGGRFAAGTLAVGTVEHTGVLALGAGNLVTAGAAIILGGVSSDGGTLAIDGALILGSASGGAGFVDATGTSAISAGSVLLEGPGSVLMTDAAGMIEIGGDAVAGAGTVSINVGGTLDGDGAVNPNGQIVDDGVILASGGTLVLGSVSGTGTLLVGLESSLVLEGSAAPGLTVDFAGAGTLTVERGVLGAAFADFGQSDAIILPVSGATAAAYAIEAPGVGVLTIFDGTQALRQLTVLGDEAAQVFTVSEAANGGTILTATSANTAGDGGDTVPSDTLVAGSNVLTSAQLQTLAEAEFPYAAAFVQQIDQDSEACDLWYLEGETTVGPPLFGGSGQPAGVDIELVAPTQGNTGLASTFILQNGYKALIAMGTEPVDLFDAKVGDALLIGNANTDPTLPTTLVTYTSGDTLVGAAGGNTEFWAQYGTTVNIQGGGNDTIVTNDVNASVTTSGGGHSLVFLGSSDNDVLSQGSDLIVCEDTVGGIADDIVSVGGAASVPGPDIFGPQDGNLVVEGGLRSAVVVGGGAIGDIVMHGGAAAGNMLWAGPSQAIYFAGAGSGIVVGGSNTLTVEGGSAPTTVYGGTSMTSINGGAPGSTDIVGAGTTTINAGIGNTVFITDSAPVTVNGNSGLVVYAGGGTGSYLFDAAAGSETLWGGAGTDQFIVGSGNDVMVSGGGKDTFNFFNGETGGSDTIVNFVAGTDLLALHGYGSKIPVLTVHGGSTFFSLADGTQVDVFDVSNLTASSFSTS